MNYIPRGMLRTKSNNMNLPLSLFDHEIRRMDLDYGRATGLFDIAVEVSEEQMTRAQDVEMRVHNMLCLLVLKCWCRGAEMDE